MVDNSKLREYKSIEEVSLKPNQVLVKPIRPVLSSKKNRKNFKKILDYFLLAIFFASGIYLLITQKDHSALGAFILGISFAIVIYKVIKK